MNCWEILLQHFVWEGSKLQSVLLVADLDLRRETPTGPARWESGTRSLLSLGETFSPLLRVRNQMFDIELPHDIESL